MNIQILIDNPRSWVVPYAKLLLEEIKNINHNVEIINEHKHIKSGNILILLSCEKILKKNYLDLNKHNLVVHASPLPKGKGMSPMAWQILKGKNELPVTLFEAVEELDAGDIYLQRVIKYRGDELIEELRDELGKVSNEMIIEFINRVDEIKGTKQTGEESFYKRRTPEDSRLDINKTIAEQFNLLRIVDNERYPAFFELYGNKYIIKIEKKK
ncbi:MAG: formyltransferase family protein [Ignavibacteriae bacterium]|nr:formyltransferase family protein [Ignavibacteriota bacterium]